MAAPKKPVTPAVVDTAREMHPFYIDKVEATEFDREASDMDFRFQVLPSDGDVNPKEGFPIHVDKYVPKDLPKENQAPTMEGMGEASKS